MKRLYALLVSLLLPPGFRGRHGRDMTEALGDRLDSARTARARLLALIGESWDVARNAPGAWAGEIGKGIRREGPSLSMDDVLQGMRTSGRALFRRPAVSLTVIATLAIGIGATTALYTVIDALVLEPLPYPDADRLVYVWGRIDEARQVELSGPEFDAIRRDTEVFSSLAEVKGSPNFASRAQDAAEIVVMTSVSTEYFDVWGIRPIIGRTFVAEDDVLLPPSVITDASSQWPVLKAVISHGFWQRRFGGDPGVVGRTVALSGRDREIIGVMPEGFHGMLPSAFGDAGEVDGWYLSPYDASQFPRDTRFIRAVGRLAPGVSLVEAGAALERLAEAERATDAIAARDDWHLDVIPLHEGVTEAARRLLPLVVGSVLIVLLIACSNVATVLLARITERSDELALRRALGGGPARLVGLVLGETVLLSLMGTAAGALLAWSGTRALVALRPAGILHLERIGMDGSVLATTALTGVGAALLATIAPALWVRDSATAAVASSARGGTAGRRFRQWGSVIVSGEVALALVLTLGAGLLVRTFIGLASVDPGFRTEAIMTAKVNPSTASYPRDGSRVRLYSRLASVAVANPEIVEFGAIAAAPLDGAASMAVEIPGRNGAMRVTVDYRRVTPGALEVLGIPIVEGRTLRWADYDDPDRLFAVVDQRMADENWPDRSPIGERIVVGRRTYGDESVVDAPIEAEVVGVARSIRGRTLRTADPPTMYVSVHFNASGDYTLVALGRRGRTPSADALRSTVAALDPDLPLFDFASMDDILGRELRSVRYALLLVGLLGAVGLTLAGTGVFGLSSYAVGLRRRELSIRAAIGAKPRSLVAIVLRDGMVVAAAGIAVGWMAALAFTRALSSLLFRVRPWDPVTFAGVATVLALVVVAGCIGPGVRAGRSDPAATLREEG